MRLVVGGALDTPAPGVTQGHEQCVCVSQDGDGDGDGDGDAFLVKGVGRGQEGAWTATTRTAPPGYPNGNVLIIAYVQASAT